MRILKYIYEDLSSDNFETLVVLLCKNLLGMSVQSFSKGPDGGRDAKFVGTAECHPSRADPWTGIVIIQAKHTNGCNKSFSDKDFFSLKSSSNIIAQEIPRIKKLRDENDLDHYMLFSNRRLTGQTDTDVRRHISEECNIPQTSIYLCGLENLELFMKLFPKIPKQAKISSLDSPLIVSPNDLSEIIEAFARQKEFMLQNSDIPPTPRTSYVEKNEINKMSDEYANALRKMYLKDTSQIKNFLAAPENIELMRQYESTTQEIQLKIIAKRREYDSFDDIMNYLVDLLKQRDAILRKNIRLTRAMIFYMYWNCDIGEEDHAKTH